LGPDVQGARAFNHGDWLKQYRQRKRGQRGYNGDNHETVDLMAKRKGNDETNVMVCSPLSKDERWRRKSSPEFGGVTSIGEDDVADIRIEQSTTQQRSARRDKLHGSVRLHLKSTVSPEKLAKILAAKKSSPEFSRCECSATSCGSLGYRNEMRLTTLERGCQGDNRQLFIV
jgi:hypothetical protein